MSPRRLHRLRCSALLLFWDILISSLFLHYISNLSSWDSTVYVRPQWRLFMIPNLFSLNSQTYFRKWHESERIATFIRFFPSSLSTFVRLGRLFVHSNAKRQTENSKNYHLPVYSEAFIFQFQFLDVFGSKSSESSIFEINRIFGVFQDIPKKNELSFLCDKGLECSFLKMLTLAPISLMSTTPRCAGRKAYELRTLYESKRWLHLSEKSLQSNKTVYWLLVLYVVK